jgi:hypothetical protein
MAWFKASVRSHLLGQHHRMLERGVGIIAP